MVSFYVHIVNIIEYYSNLTTALLTPALMLTVKHPASPLTVGL